MKAYKVLVVIIIFLVTSANALTTVYCDFNKIASTYICNPTSIELISKESDEFKVNGTHLNGFKDEDVSYVRFNSPLTLHYVPTNLFEIFQNIEIFGLQNVNLINITSESFMNCFKLKSLHIDGNKQLTEIPAGFAESCGNLENLYMPGNDIKSIDKDAFEGLDKLHYLVLTKNKIQELHADVFIKIGNLQNLFLDHNQIKSIYPNLFYPLRKLQLLSITHNQIEEVSLQLFRNNPLLDQIFFDHNQIYAIDEKFFGKFPGSREIYEFRFSSNNCTNSIVSNKKEGIEDFSDFDVCFKFWNETHQEMQDEVEFLTDYEITIASETTTTELLTVENEYYVRDCRYYLNENHKYTCVLENVDHVLPEIGGKHYKGFNDESVTQLFFFNSTLAKVPSMVFKKFPNLQYLSVANTKMTIINDGTFDECGKLKEIDASKNSIFKIVETSFRNCKYLKTIDISGNPIEFIDGEIFYYDPQLKHIILRRNY